MVENTATTEHDIAPQSTDMEIQHSSDLSEKKTELDARDSENQTVEETVRKDAEPENDGPPPNGGVKAWLCVLATLFMFISAW